MRSNMELIQEVKLQWTMEEKKHLLAACFGRYGSLGTHRLVNKLRSAFFVSTLRAVGSSPIAVCIKRLCIFLSRVA